MVTREFADVTECMKRQAPIEREPLAAGYHLARTVSDCRSDHGI
jgi:hypothetical protein